MNVYWKHVNSLQLPALAFLDLVPK